MKYYLKLFFLISIIMLPEIGTAQLGGDYDLGGIYKESYYVVRELSSQVHMDLIRLVFFLI